jgi:hypothetical protein
MEVNKRILYRQLRLDHAITVSLKPMLYIKLKDEVGKFGIALCRLFVKLLSNDHLVITARQILRTGVRYQSFMTPDMFLTTWLILKCSTNLENFHVFYRIRTISDNWRC